MPGVADARRGQAVRAAVVLREGSAVDAEALIALVGERLAQYKRPTAIDFVEEIPRTGSGKALRRVLAEPFTES